MPNSFSLYSFRRVAGAMKRSFVDIPDEQMREQPLPGMNPPVWVLGHLVFVLNRVPQLLGQPRLCPDEYGKWFGPASKLEDLPADLPGKSDMLDQLNQVCELILTELPKLSDEDLAKPNALGFAPTELPTMWDVYETLLLSHSMLHLGQMSVWRRVKKLPPAVSAPKK